MTPGSGPHLDTPNANEVAARSVSSGAVAIASNIVQMAIGIGTTLVLVRILDPADYGLYYMGGMVLLLSVAVRDLGIGTAVVNAPDLSKERASGLFWCVALVTLAVAVLIAASGLPLSLIFGSPELVPLMPVLGVVSLVHGIGAVHDGLLKRRMRFVAVACRDIGGMLAGSLIAIGVASAGHDHWALAGQQVAIACAGLVVVLIACPWVPGSPKHLRTMLRTGSEATHLWHGARIATTRLVGLLGIIADRVSIGAVAGERPLGLYNQSYQWAEFPTRQVYQPLMAVVVSTFSRRQDQETDGYRRSFRQVLLVLFGVTIPMLVYGAMRAELVIPVLLGEKWIDAAPLFRWLCVAFLFRLMVQACKWLYLGESRSADNLRWTAALTPVLVIAAAAGATQGAIGVAIAIAAAYAAAAPVAVWYGTRNSRVLPQDLVLPTLRPLLGSAFGLVGVLVLGEAAGALTAEDVPAAALLVAEVALFMLAGAVAWALPGPGRDDLLECIRTLAARGRPRAHDADGNASNNDSDRGATT
ncbi:MAG: oligosaccharide flippase family protein [Planctomycetota bacterium]